MSGADRLVNESPPESVADRPDRTGLVASRAPIFERGNSAALLRVCLSRHLALNASISQASSGDILQQLFGDAILEEKLDKQTAPIRKLLLAVFAA